MKMTVEQREREVRKKKKKRKLMRKRKRKRKRKTSTLNQLDQNVFWLNLLDHNVGSSYTNLQYLT